MSKANTGLLKMLHIKRLKCPIIHFRFILITICFCINDFLLFKIPNSNLEHWRFISFVVQSISFVVIEINKFLISVFLSETEVDIKKRQISNVLNFFMDFFLTHKMELIKGNSTL
jgi:hypothetical protein